MLCVSQYLRVDNLVVYLVREGKCMQLYGKLLSHCENKDVIFSFW